MNERDLLRAGELDAALQSLQAQVRLAPAEPKHRVFLFQLLSVLGDWQRALAQLNVAGELDAGAAGLVQLCRSAIACELFRAEVYAAQRTPLIFGEPPPWIGLLVEALRLTACGHYQAAGPLRVQAFDAAPAQPGSINGEPFQWLADTDSRLGPVLEAYVEGRYFWIPMCHVRRIRFNPPADLRDVVWTPAYFTWTNGGEAVGLVPTRYPGSESSADAQIRLARKTVWQEHPGGTVLGLGQRTLATDRADYALMDIREIDFDESEAAEAEADSACRQSDGA
jgi:type VI secretion system protein ImpE